MTEFKLKKFKTTPGTVVYGQVSSTGEMLPKEFSMIPSLYIKKDAFQGDWPPTFIKVVLE